MVRSGQPTLPRNSPPCRRQSVSWWFVCRISSPCSTVTLTTGSPEEKSTPRWRAAAMAAVARCRGSTQASSINRAARCVCNAGSNSARGRGGETSWAVPRLGSVERNSVAGRDTTMVPVRRRSISKPDSSWSSRTNSGYMRALAVASSRNSGRVSAGKSHNIPPAAHDASRAGSPFSTSRTRRPCLFNSRASVSPIMPAPTTIASQVFTRLF